MPQPTAVLQVEGVLRKPVTGQPIYSGKLLYLALSTEYNLVLVSEGDSKLVKEWLVMNGLDKHGHIHFSTAPLTPKYWHEVVKALKINHGYPVQYVVQPDPETAEILIHNGYNSLLVTNASYALPEWLPEGRGPVPKWRDLVDEVDRQAIARANDRRMSGH